jgi:hypothetical protein
VQIKTTIEENWAGWGGFSGREGWEEQYLEYIYVEYPSVKYKGPVGKEIRGMLI